MECSIKGFFGGSVKNLSASAGDVGLNPRLGKFPGEGNGNLLQYSYLGNPTDREVWQVHGVANGQTSTHIQDLNLKIICGQ